MRLRESGLRRHLGPSDFPGAGSARTELRREIPSATVVRAERPAPVARCSISPAGWHRHMTRVMPESAGSSSHVEQEREKYEPDRPGQTADNHSG
jgi:hypothetical protein